MKITIKLLKEWDVHNCSRGDEILPWFEKEFPKGIEDTPEGLINRMPDEWEFDKLWLLYKIIEKGSGKEAGDALDLLLKFGDGTRLAHVVNNITHIDTTKALDKLLKDEDELSLKIVTDKCTDPKKIEKAIDKIYEISSPEAINFYEKNSFIKHSKYIKMKKNNRVDINGI